MATEVTHIIDPDAGSGYDYLSLNAWEAAQNRDLVTVDQIAIASCRASAGSADTTAVTISGWTTSATNYIKIYTTAEARHSGVWDDSKYRLSINSSSAPLSNSQEYTVIDGLQFKNIGTGASVTLNTSSTLSNSILVKDNEGSAYNLNLYAPSGIINLYNLIVLGNSVDGIVTRYYGSTVSTNLYSSTIIGHTNGINGYRTAITAKNCYSGDNSTNDYTGTVNKTTSASSDATGSAGLQNIAYNTSNFINVTATSENLHLVSGSSLKDVGIDTSGESVPLNFTTDIDGETRSGSWDIGADEYVAAGDDETVYLDLKVTIKNSETRPLDAKVQIKDTATNLLDLKAVIANTATNLLDCKVAVQDDATNLLDLKVAIKDTIIGLLDLKAAIANTATNLLDLKAAVQDDATNLLDLKVAILDDTVNLLDLKAQIKDIATNLLDCEVRVLDVDTGLLDGRISIKSNAINLLDGNVVITTTTPIDKLDLKVNIYIDQRRRLIFF